VYFNRKLGSPVLTSLILFFPLLITLQVVMLSWEVLTYLKLSSEILWTRVSPQTSGTRNLSQWDKFGTNIQHLFYLSIALFYL
jgi:hypothetical protein